MADFSSPLRYPGGKAGIAMLLAEIIRLNDLRDCVLVEPYAGGAGAALTLLQGEHVSRVILNDADRSIYAFWWSILRRTARFLELMEQSPVTLPEWHRQRAAYLDPRRRSLLRLGFATFFLNRCNRSGIIGNGGPIGGQHQEGTWRVNARFNKTTLRHRIERIANFRERIDVYNLDAIRLLQTVVKEVATKRPVFVYLDPPYYAKAPNLYLNAYTPGDHVRLARFMRPKASYRWVMTYDNVQEVRALYKAYRCTGLRTSYTAYERRPAAELLIYPEKLRLPANPADFLSGSMSARTARAGQ